MRTAPSTLQSTIDVSLGDASPNVCILTLAANLAVAAKGLEVERAGIPLAGRAIEVRATPGIERHRFPQIGTITVSIGWTKIRPQDMPATAIERADAALYHAKASGRNQVIRQEQLLADGRLAGSTLLPAEIELF